MSFGFGISDFEYVFSLVMRVKNFLSDIAEAPSDWSALRAEADCLAVCLKVIRYKQSRRVLKEISRGQRKDLLTIIEGCELNMAELIGFVAQTQSIAISESGKRKPATWSIKRMWNKLMSEGINLWTKIRFVNKDKQPMREKIAIPTQSLNIYLVSLTFISLSYNTRLSGGPGGVSIKPPKWTEQWDVVGEKVAFKEAEFSRTELLKPGVEDAIILCAEKKVAAGATKMPGKKPAGSGGTGGIKIPKRPRRRSSFGPRGTNTDPDGLFLVRAKSRARSKARVNSSVEIVKADYDFESNSGSDSAGFGDEIISPRRPRSPNRGGGGGGGGGAAYEDRSPDRDAHRPSSHEQGLDHDEHERHNSDDEDEARELLYYEREGYKRAKEEIKKDRKRAIREMTYAVAEEAEASRRVSARSLSRSAEPGEPDVRAYMETRYGVIIDRATEQEEIVNATSARTSTVSYLSQAPKVGRKSTIHFERKNSEEETIHRSRVGEKLCDSDVSSDSDSDPEIVLNLRPESRYHAKNSRKESKDKFKREDTVTREDLFTIPRTEYVSRTETYEGRPSGNVDRDRERFIQQQERFVSRREADLEQREQIFRERELALLARERQLNRREHSPGPRDRAYEDPPIIIQPHERVVPRYQDEYEDLRHQRSGPNIRRASSYAGPSRPDITIRQDHPHPDSDDESMYGRPIVEPPPPPEARRRTRRKSRSSSDEDGREFIVQPRRR